MAQFDDAIWELNSADFLGYTGDVPANESEYNSRKGGMFSKDAPTWSDIQARVTLLNVLDVREKAYPPLKEFAEAYCEKEIGDDSTKWNAYVTKYNLVRSNNPKPD
jgi:hypothetical protein